MFAQRVTSGEKLLFSLRANDDDAGVLYLIFRVVEAPLRQLERADGKDVGIVSGHIEGEGPRLILDVGLLIGFGSDLTRFEECLW